MSEIAVLVFLAVFLALMALVTRSRRDRLKEEIQRHNKTPFSDIFKARDVLSKTWRVSGYSPLPYDQAFSLGMFSGVGAFLLVFILFRNVSPPAIAVALALGIVVFLGVPYMTNDVLLDGKIKDFRNNIEFGLETLVSVLAGTGGDLPAAVREVARVGPGVVGKELTLVRDEIQSHKPLKDAFAALALRVPCREARDIADAAELYETVGGASALALFRDLSGIVQETNYSRSKVEKKFRTMKFYAWLVAIIPVPLNIFLFLQHSWASLLVQTNEGHNAVALAVLLYMAAFGLMYFVFQFGDV